MADRYWVGGTGSWDATTTNWSATSGGAGGASVPTFDDDVFFNSASNATAYTVTLTTAPVCRSVSIAGAASGNVTIAGSAAWSIYGSMAIAATGVTWTNTSTINFRATTTGWTITTNGVSLSNGIIFNGTGGGWTLGSALTNTSAAGMTLTEGAFNTANFNLTTTGGFASTGALTRSLTLGSSAISFNSWSALGATNLTVNAGTSTITLTGAAGAFNGGGLTYYNVFKNLNGFAIGDANNTFNALTNNSVNTIGTFVCSFAGNQTIGTLTVNGGSDQTRRASIQTSAALAGTQITLTVGSFVTNGRIDFRDINFQGAASPLTVATGGDCGNNTNITLQTPKTVYWSLVAGGNWTATAWALTSGGAPALANYPLAQDTIVIENTGLTSGNTITLNVSPNLGTIGFSTRTLPMTFSILASASVIYGDLTFSSAVTVTSSAAGVFTFSGYNKTQTITSAGITIEAGVAVNNLSTTVTFPANTTLGTTKTFTLTQGTFNLVNNTLTCGLFNTNNSNTRTLAFGTGQINLTGNAATVWNFNVATNLTITGSAIVNANYSGSTGTRSISGYGTTGTARINLNITAGSDIVTVFNSGYNNLNFTGFTGQTNVSSTTVSGNYTLNAGMTVNYITGALLFNGTSGTQLITTNGVTVDSQVQFNGIGGTFRLQGALTIGSTRSATLINGALDLNNNNFTCGIFSSANTNTRSIAFGTGQIYVTGNNTFNINLDNMTGFTYTGSGILNATYSGSTGNRGLVFGNTAGGTEINALNINITAGTDGVRVYGAGIRSINFTGFAGTWTEAGSRTMYGDLTISTGMSISATTETFFSASSGTQSITSNSKTVTFSIYKSGAGTLRLLDALTLTTTRTFVLLQGVFDLNGNNLTTGLFDSYNAFVRQLLIGSNTIEVTGTTWSVYDANFSISGSGTINMSAATAKSFIGNGYSYPTLNQGGAGALLITGSNTFANITNTAQPATVTIESGTTTSVTNFSLLGTAGNLITLNSSLAGAQATLIKTTEGAISLDYLSIQDSNATPALTWYAGTTSTNVSNNTGWVFNAPAKAINGLFFGFPF
jgi:hypothetical protein